MKRILGLDLGTNSIGWALVNEKEAKYENSSIVKLGVRVNPLTVDEKTDFEKGRPLTTNASRTLKRSMRRNLQRYKLRRNDLIAIMKENGWISRDTPLTEIGKDTTHQTLALRAKAAREKVDLEDLAKILLSINKKRGYKSNRKVKDDDQGLSIDGMAIAKKLYDENLTPGQYVLRVLKAGRKYIPDFYRSDLITEFNRVWNKQIEFYPGVMTNSLYHEVLGKNKKQTWAICEKPFNIVGVKRKGSFAEKKLENFEWRVKALSEEIELEKLVIVLQEINNDLNKSSGYLGAISDRSKKLYFNRQTVGEYLYNQLQQDPHTSLKNQVFYRQDYLDEFERIWETQAQHYSQLTPKLKEEIRDTIIFFQRKLKSQKGQLSYCQFERWEQQYEDPDTGSPKKRTIGRPVIPKASPLFQEFKIWQNLNSLVFSNTEESQEIKVKDLDCEIRQELFDHLTIRGASKPVELLRILKRHIKLGRISKWKANYDKIEGNSTNATLFNCYQRISENEGYGIDWNSADAQSILHELKNTLPEIGINPSILTFDSEKKNIDKQLSYQLWHLLYSAEEDFKIEEKDKIVYGNSAVSLKKKLHNKFGFKPDYAKMLANISFSQDYGNLSAKAIRKILPFLKDGHVYSEACRLAGYNHSSSLTSEQLKNRELKPHLELLSKNSLRNPVVEKILNQMVNVVNQIIETYGKPDEVRIELARELKKSAKERAEMAKGIGEATRRNEDIRKLIIKKFGIPSPTKNDIVRYRLYQELESRGFKEVFTDRYIAPDQIFSKEIDIEHIIPKALLFDDSYSNKTLAFKEINLKKGNRTALDFISEEFNQNLESYRSRVEELYKSGSITKGKRNKLLLAQSEISDGFIERDLRNSQYIARKAREMLFEVFADVTVTTGSITEKLRKDWDLVNVMKELNMPKYKAAGLTIYEERLDIGTGKFKKYEIIKDWSKRNDHRHHAMDALTVAFTTKNHIQYINNLNARRDTSKDNHPIIRNIENQITEINMRGKLIFRPPLNNFRTEAKDHIESILVSFKTKNKVVTRNVNKTQRKNGKLNYKVQLTPRGQLHKETVYGKSKRLLAKPTRLNKRFSLEQAQLIADKKQREAVLKHLKEYEGNSEKAFSTNSLKTRPLCVDGEELKEVLCYEEIFTIRKDVTPNNFKNDKLIEKIIDQGVRNVMKNRLAEYKGDYKRAFSDLDTNPIYLNKTKGIKIKRVTITGVSNAEPLHFANDHLGRVLKQENGHLKPVDYVSTGNNHHVAIYKDGDGNLQEEVVSFFEAVTRKNQGQDVIQREHPKGWKFLFTMKQNEMFVFPNEGFNPGDIDLLDESNAKVISENLFRVQKIATKNYFFRHHLETTVEQIKELKNLTYKPQLGLNAIHGIVKVRINHLGKIIHVGEY